MAKLFATEAAGRIIDAAVQTYGDLNIVVNNAGFTRDKMIFSMTEEAFDDVGFVEK